MTIIYLKRGKYCLIYYCVVNVLWSTFREKSSHQFVKGIFSRLKRIPDGASAKNLREKRWMSEEFVITQ